MPAWSVGGWSSAIPFVQTNEVRVVGGARIAPSGSITVVSGATIGWSSSATDPTVAADTIQTRDAANIWAQRNGTTAQILRVYNTFTDAANYERVALDWVATANIVRLATEAAGTGTARELQIGTAGLSTLSLVSNATRRWIISSTAPGDFTPNTTNTNSIGTAALRPLTVFAGTNGIDSTGAVLFSGTNNTSGATALTVIAGGFGFNTITAAASAPGAAGGKIEWRCGTNAGTIKIVAYGGTSATGVTVTDNIGAGVTGC